MRILLSLMHKRFLSSSPSSSSSSSTVECLVNSCGLPSKSALEFSRDFHLHENNLQSFQSVFRCFQSYNIPSIRITKLIKRRPQILNYNVEDNLKPKLQLLVQNGIVGHHMCKVFVSNPLILNADLDSQIKPCFQFLKSVLGSNRNVVEAINRSSNLLTCDLKVNDLKNLGFDPKAPVFLEAVRVRIHMSESIWKEKIEVMKSLGWSEEEIFSAFKRDPIFLKSALEFSRDFHLHENNLQSFQSVFRCFQSYNIPSIRITKLIKRRPQILNYNVEDNLKPKLQLLVQNGIVGHHMYKVFVSNPIILNADLDSQITPCFQFLKSVLGSNRNVVEAINRSSHLLTCDLKGCLQPNIDFLIREGVPFDGVAEFLIRDAITVQHKHNNMVNAVNDLKNLGFDPKAPVFLEAVRVRIHMSESIWKEKIEVMKSLGWSEEEIFSAFKRDPIFLKSPVEKIRVATDFFSEKLIEGGVKIEEVLKMRDKEFLVKYVKKYVDKVPGLWETFNGRKQQQSLPGLTELNFWQCYSNGEKQLVESREIIIDGLVKKHPPDHALPKQLKLFLMTKLCCMQNFGTDCGVDNEPMDATSQK
ncbi:hypothetical protein NC652_000483 [Populus alba x Populus x berolinensis]|nr:hypothetical protein NC652_000483 [Populus alba x Populus x berolinensis]